MSMTKTALVLGVTGGIGGETAAALMRHGWEVVAMVRDPEKAVRSRAAARLKGLRFVAGDAMNAADPRRAAEGVSAIVHAVNPPGYRRWGDLVLPMIDNSIAAARAAGARLVLPGTIYNYGPDAFPLLSEASPQHPVTRKGHIRVELERRIEAASREAPALIVRFGDFFGPEPGNSWFSQGLVTPGQRLAAITYPGRAGTGHAWSYLPDAGETIAALLDQGDRLEPFARFHAAGLFDADGTAMIAAIRAALGRPDLPVRGLPWPLLGLAGLVSETPRELYRTRALWRTPIRLDNRKLMAFLGAEPQTPLREAVATTLLALGVT